MDRKQFILATLGLTIVNTLSSFRKYTDELPVQGKKMPVLFTSHGNPMDIPLSREERTFWNTLFQLGKELKKNYEVKAALVVSAHWCTRGTFVNV
jgi:4,5-DOPA dioxygenase extradiol